MRQTRDQMLKATAPDCARFLGYGGGNALVFNWHRIEIRFPTRRLSDAGLARFQRDTGAIVLNDWDFDDLTERAAMMGFRCSDL